MTNSPEGRLLTAVGDQLGYFTRQQAIAYGMSDSTLRRRVNEGRYLRVANGVFRVCGVPDTFKSQVMEAVLCSGFGAAASHRTAAYLWGLMDRPEVIEIVTSRTGRRRKDGYILHQSTDLVPAHVTTVDGIPTTTTTRTAIDVGVPHGIGATARVIDEGQRRGILDLHATARLLHHVARKGRNGAGPARRILTERLRWDQITESQLEDMFVRLLQRSGLPQPVGQYTIQDGQTFIARVDFAYPNERIAVELDGYESHGERGAFTHDRRRQNKLILLGWTVLRFTYWDLLAGEVWVLDTVQSALTPNWEQIRHM